MSPTAECSNFVIPPLLSVVVNVLFQYGSSAKMPHWRLNIYCSPTVTKLVRILLSLLSSSDARDAPLHFLCWFELSYSRNAMPPGWVGIIERVATSKTPQPQAQAWTVEAKQVLSMNRAESNQEIPAIDR